MGTFSGGGVRWCQGQCRLNSYGGPVVVSTEHSILHRRFRQGYGASCRAAGVLGTSRRDSDLFSGARADEATTWGRRDTGAAVTGDSRGGESWGAPRRSDSVTGGGGGGERKRLTLAKRTKPAPVIKVTSSTTTFASALWWQR